MPRNLAFDCPRQGREPSLFPGVLHRLAPAYDHEDGDRDQPWTSLDPIEREDLPYKVELWDAAKAGVERVLAVTASASIGFAAFYGATREFPDRYITLRHKSSIISQWNEPRH
jgi:hypothetical protein